MSFGRQSIIVKVGDTGSLNPVKRHGCYFDGMVIGVYRESDYGATLEDIFSDRMGTVYAIIETNPDWYDFIKSEIGMIGKGTDILIPDKQKFRVRGKYIRLSELAAACGDVSLEAAWRGKGVVPIQNLSTISLGAFTGLLRTTLERKLTNPLISDLNAISSGSYTCGSGGDYADFDAAWADLTNLTGNLTLTGIGAFTHSSVCWSNISLGGYTLRNTSNYDHLGDPTRSTNLITYNHSDCCFSFDINGSGNLNFDKLYMKRTANGSAWYMSAIFGYDTATGFTLNASDILMDGNGQTNCCGLRSDWSTSNHTVYAHNIKAWDHVYNFYISDWNSSSVIENSDSYNAGTDGFNMTSEPGILRNCNSFDSGTTDFANVGSLGTFSKCAASDTTGSEASLDSLTASNEYESTSDSSSDFLKQKRSGSLWDGGDTTLSIGDNDAGIEGNKRPTGGNRVSIGANQITAGGIKLVNSPSRINRKVGGLLV